MKFASLMLPSLGLVAVASLAGGTSFSPTLASASSPCHASSAQDTTVGYAPGNPVTSALPTVYTDGGNSYVGVCGGTAGPTESFVQVNNVRGAAAGQNSVVDGQTGQAAVDGQIWAYGPASVWLNGDGPASPTPACAPSTDNRAGHSNGNNASRELPSVYTDGGNSHIGVCGGAAGPTESFVQVNNVRGAVAGQNSLADGQTGQAAVDQQLWAYGPASVWLNGGGPASPTPACAPTDDNRVGHSNGNNASRELPSVYTDGGNNHVGVCGGNGRVQLNALGSAHPVTVQGAPVPPPLP